MKSSNVKNKTKPASKKEDWSEMLEVHGKAGDVTPQNYHVKCRSFAMHHAKHSEDVGVTINPIDNPQQWGAWLNYFKTKKIKHAFMVFRGNQCADMSRVESRAAHGFQVPSSMPSDFDGDWDFVSDNRAGDAFMAAQDRARERMKSIADTPEERADVVRKAMMRLRRHISENEVLA